MAVREETEPTTVSPPGYIVKNSKPSVPPNRTFLIVASLRPLRKRVISWLKIGLPLALVAALIGHTWWKHPETLRQIANPQNRVMLAASFGVILLAVLMSFFRWHLLLRALQIPIRLRDTLRLSFLGFLLNFVAPGAWVAIRSRRSSSGMNNLSGGRRLWRPSWWIEPVASMPWCWSPRPHCG